MSRRHQKYQFGNVRPGVNLDAILDTAETFHVKTEAAPTQYDRSVKVPPPFRGDEAEPPVKMSQVSLAWKIAGVMLVVVVPCVWFAANLNFSVDNLLQDMDEIKSKTDSLVTNSIKQGGRLDNLERSVATLQNNSASGKSK